VSKLLKDVLKRDDSKILITLMRKYLFKIQRDIFEGKLDTHDWEAEYTDFQVKHLAKMRDQHIAREARVHSKGKFHPSSLSGCRRALYFKTFRAPRNPPFSADDAMKEHLIFTMGDMVHLRHQALFYMMGILEAAEVPIEDEENDIEGHTDCILNIEGKRYIQDSKSINARGFSVLFKEGVQDGHVTQIQSYMMATGIKDGILLYENKDRHDLFEEDLTYDADITDEVIESIDVIKGHILRKDVPDKEGESPNAAICMWCPFTQLCHTPAKMEAFLKTVKGKKHARTNKTKIRIGPRTVKAESRTAKREGSRSKFALKKFSHGG